MTPPVDKALILRITHVDNLPIFLRRGGLYAPNFTPNDGLFYKTIHHESIQQRRAANPIPCGPGGVIHDYVPFYFGPLSPMLYSLHKGYVSGYTEGQKPLIYLVSSIADVLKLNLHFVFSDGHGIAFDTSWYSQLTDLDKVDWGMVNQRYWKADHENDPDRQRRKQAEFLVHGFAPWALIRGLVVIDSQMKSITEQAFSGLDPQWSRAIYIKPDWYY